MEKNHTFCAVPELVLPMSLVPPIPYFTGALAAQKLVIDGCEHYVKQTVRNRYHVLTANGVKALTIPAVGQKGDKIPTAQIAIDHSKPWLRDHLRTIEAAYRSAPFYEHYIDKVRGILAFPADTFGQFFEHAMPLWQEMLKVEVKFQMSNEYLTANNQAWSISGIKSPADFPPGTPYAAYVQVFADRFGFQPHLSILDLIFNEGPASGTALMNV